MNLLKLPGVVGDFPLATNNKTYIHVTYWLLIKLNFQKNEDWGKVILREIQLIIYH